MAQGDVLGQTLQPAELCAGREHGKEKQRRCPIGSRLGGQEDGSTLNANSDHGRRSNLWGKIMNYLDILSLTKLEHIQLSGSQQ